MQKTDNDHDNHRQWKREIAPFETPSVRSSVWQLVNTILPFIALWVLAYESFHVSIWLTLALTVPTALFLVRTFILFHDCCHFSFFKSHRANVVVGTLTGLLTFFPYQQWKHEHAVHHATSGNLSKRGTGDIWTLTVAEYHALTFWRRLSYRVYRNPVIMFGLGPIYLFLIEYRLNNKGAGRKERVNTYLTNVTLAAILTVLCVTLGWEKVLLLQGMVLYLSGMAGIWLFYVQHQFEDTYYEKNEDWDFVRAAMQGSSFYKLPKVLQWLTGNIGFHHIHHLSARVPNYKLERLCKSHPELANVPSIGFLTSLKALSFRLWDENTKRYTSFRQAQQSQKFRNIV